jgi:diaminohydroxyphosphoribosylaminopyrimidine deaminase/5-amino-6-(5-phosphoribosylamino)uracil reductase
MKSTGQSLDVQYIKQTLRLAKKGLGYTSPNPMVGAVIIKNGIILGSGYHHKAGEAHAEIEALRSFQGSFNGATLYVNLEPCTHQGKTPPCTEAIIKAGISRVVIGTLDPNPLVSGKGVARLKKAGIEVSVGFLSDEARTLNETFFCLHEQGRPFIAIKFAGSLDGKIATASHDSKWITSEKARRYSQNLRSHYQAILVGINTVIEDDPHLGTRVRGKVDPLRIILDSTLHVPLKSQVLRDNNVLIVTTGRADQAKQKILTRRGVPLFVCPGDSIELPHVMQELVSREVISLLVEGGGTVLGSFVDNHLVDKVYAFYGPLIIGGVDSVAAIAGTGAAYISQSLKLSDLSSKKLDDTFLLIGYSSSK